MLKDRRILSITFCSLLIVLTGIIIYSNSFYVPFQFDDTEFIVNNPAIKYIFNIKAIWNAYPGEPTRFISFLTFALNYHFHQLDVFGYHFVNIIIHVVNGLFVYYLTYSTLGVLEKRFSLRSKSKKSGWEPLEKIFDQEENQCQQQKRTFALFTALLFLVHPVQTQAVTYITQRFTSLVTMFYLMTLCFYIKGRLSGGHNSRFYFCGAIISMLLAMFTKEISFTLPLAILVYELFFFNEKPLKTLLTKRTTYIVFLLLVLLLLIIPMMYTFDFKGLIARELPNISHQNEVMTSGTYFLTQLRVIVVYLRLLLIPVNQNLEYDFPLSQSIFEMPTFLSLLILLSLLYLAVRLYSTHRIISFGIVWFFLTLSVESSIIPIPHVIFEHRMYLPSIGFCLVAISFLYKISGSYKIFLVWTSCLLIVFSFLTFQRNKVWKDAITLWSDVSKKSPNKPRPHSNLGFAYAAQGDYEKALHEYNMALQLDPYYADAYLNKANVFYKRNQIEMSMGQVQKALSIDPDHVQGLNLLGNINFKKVQYHSAQTYYQKALRIKPNFPEAYYNLGLVYEKLGKYNLAFEAFNNSITLKPLYANAYNGRGLIHVKRRHLDLAIDDFRKTLSLQPEHKNAYNNLTYVILLKNQDKNYILP